MKIRVNGEEFIGYETAQASRHFLDLSGTFTFTASPLSLRNQDYPIQVQQSCEILVENTPFVTGYIEEINVSSGAQDVQVTISGRDKTCDLIDSSIDNNFISQFDGPVKLADICRKALQVLGIRDVEVIERLDLPPLQQGTYVLPFIGERAFEFLQHYAKLSQVYLVADGLGNIVITQSVSVENAAVLLPTILINQFEGNNNNVLSANYHVSTMHQYHIYRDYSQLSTTALEGGNSLRELSTLQTGEAINSVIRPTRQWVFVDDIPIDGQTGPKRAAWELNYRRAKGEYYKCTVSNHTYDGVNIWQPNVLVLVYDDFAGLNGRILMIDEVKYYESVPEGQTTELRCVDPLSYTLQTQKNYYQARSDDPEGTKYFDENTLPFQGFTGG